MPLFIKRPVTITADRWFRNGDHPDDYAKPVQGFERGHTVCPGDWAITGVAGERYPAKPDIFEATYAPVSG